MSRTGIWPLLAGVVATAAALIALSLVYGTGRASSQESGPAGPGAWTQMAIPGLSDGTRVYAVRRAGELILVGTQGQGVLRSADGGATWQQVPQLGSATVRDLWLGGADDQTALAATFGAGLLRSIDGGANWLPTGANIRSNLLYSLASGGGVLYLGTADAGVWRSTDQGASWAATGAIDSPGAVAVAALSAQVAYAGSVNNGLYQTRDGGATWQQIGFAGKTVRALALDARDSKQVWASVLGDGVYHSADSGQNWQAASAGLDGANVLALLVTNSGGGWQVLAGAHGRGLLRWTGSDWAAWGLSGLDVYSLAPWSDTLYAGTNSQVWEYGFPPTPTPGLALLLLRNDPVSAIQPGGEVLYTIHYRNGPLPLAQVAISNTIPLHVVLAPGSISAGGVSSGSDPGHVVSWDVGDLDADAAGSVSYRVQRPDSAPTITPTITLTPTITPTPTGTWTPTAAATSTATATPSPTRPPRSTSPTTNAATPIATETFAAAPSPTPAASPAAIAGLSAPNDDVTILNTGATAGWRFDGQPGLMTSNSVANPSVIWYLPLIYRR